MGQGASKNKKQDNDPKGLASIISYIATNYIMTQNFRDMRKLADPEYCDKLVVMTANILNDYLDNREVKFLAQKIRQGVEVNEMANEKLSYMRKDDVSKLDVRSKIEKKRMCIGIAKYYVKVAHIFAAIVTTINPEYVYKNRYGETKRVPLSEKKNIPADANPRLTRFNICQSRLDALIGSQATDAEGDIMTVKPAFCNINVRNGQTRSLSSEPGIPELKQLYYDEYNYETGHYSSMSSAMQKQYLSDVRKMYSIFTGEKDVPPGIKSFSDIKLKDFHNSKGCTSGGLYTKGYQGSVKDKLFAQYADHIKTMMKKVDTVQNKLLEVIDQLFSFSVNPQTLQKEITISASLTDSSLQKIVEKTRSIIIELYVTCETEFTTGLEIFEAIVEKQIMETSKTQLDNLKKDSEDQIIDANDRVGNGNGGDDNDDEGPAPPVPAPPAPAPPAPAPTADVVDVEDRPGEEVVVDVEPEAQGRGGSRRKNRKRHNRKTRRKH